VRTSVFSCLVLAALLTGCGGGQTDAQKVAATLSGEDKIAADKNPQCKLFTPAELAKYVGTPLSAGRDAAMGSGCQWLAVSGTGSAMIQVVPADYHEPHSGAPGFRNVPDVGTRGFVEQELGGWNAGAIAGGHSVVVSVAGAKTTDATAIELLKETIKRRTK
jgi:hypothetical protein